jgi:hypothetical protein
VVAVQVHEVKARLELLALVVQVVQVEQVQSLAHQ